MEIKTSYEVWNEVPNEDKDNIANTKKWVSVESLLATPPEDLMEEIQDLYEQENLY